MTRCPLKYNDSSHAQNKFEHGTRQAPPAFCPLTYSLCGLLNVAICIFNLECGDSSPLCIAGNLLPAISRCDQKTEQ